MGRWEGLTGDEIRALDAAAFAAWMADVGGYRFPDGENLEQLAARAWPALQQIIATHPEEAVLVVAHGGTNRVLLCKALGIAPDRILALGQDYAAVSVLERSAGGWRLSLLNHREPIGDELP
jgi:broad specificity phosphatase PhoE